MTAVRNLTVKEREAVKAYPFSLSSYMTRRIEASVGAKMLMMARDEGHKPRPKTTMGQNTPAKNARRVIIPEADILAAVGSGSRVSAISEALEVTPSTARNRLYELKRQGKVEQSIASNVSIWRVVK